MKSKVVEVCKKILNDKISELEQSILHIQESMKNESKSTAGDKHETGRAMLQLEQEKLGEQLKELTERRNEFDKLDTQLKVEQITNGAYIVTDKGNFFLAIALGKIKVQNTDVYCLSAKSPLGNKFSGLRVTDKVEMNGMLYTIKEIS